MNMTRDFQSCIVSARWIPLPTCLPQAYLHDFEVYAWLYQDDTWTVYEVSSSGTVVLNAEMTPATHSWRDL